MRIQDWEPDGDWCFHHDCIQDRDSSLTIMPVVHKETGERRIVFTILQDAGTPNEKWLPVGHATEQEIAGAVVAYGRWLKKEPLCVESKLDIVTQAKLIADRWRRNSV